MLKIAYFIDSFDPGGAETLVIEICGHVRKYGYDPEIWHFGNQWLIEKGKDYDIPMFIVPGYRFYKSIYTLPLFTYDLVRFIKKRKIDILHSHLFGTITGAFMSTFLTRILHIGTIHDTYTLEKKHMVYILRLATIFGTKLVSVSTQMQNYIINVCKFPAGSLIVILNGINLGMYLKDSGVNVLTGLGLDKNNFIIISVGRLVEIKGHDIVIEAMCHIRKCFRPVKLLIVGDGPEKEKYARMIQDKRLEDIVMLLGFRDDIPDLLNSADCFVLASRSEGLSCSILEAMAAGLPVVTTDVGGNSELVENNISGYLVPPEEPIMLANKLLEIIEDDEKRGKFGNKSLEIVHNKFSVTTMVEHYVSLYKSFV